MTTIQKIRKAYGLIKTVHTISFDHSMLVRIIFCSGRHSVFFTQSDGKLQRNSQLISQNVWNKKANKMQVVTVVDFETSPIVESLCTLLFGEVPKHEPKKEKKRTSGIMQHVHVHIDLRFSSVYSFIGNNNGYRSRR